MRRSTIIIAALALLLPASVVADDEHDLVGTWVGTSRAVVAGTGGHYGEGEDLAAFREVELTVEWLDQDDGRLIGTISSPLVTEPKVGVISADGKTIVTADTDGASIGRIIDEDTFELCYTQTSIEDPQIVASCVVFTRVVE